MSTLLENEKNISIPRPCPRCGNNTVEPPLIWLIDQQDVIFRLGRRLNCNMVYVTNSDEVDISNRRSVMSSQLPLDAE
jgi:hypothetical protein